MARPRKNPEDRKDYHLRVPLTEAQRTLIEKVAKLEDSAMATWARSILLGVAERKMASKKKNAGQTPETPG